MIGPGQSYAEMITGPFIPSRDEREAGGKHGVRPAAPDMFRGA
jgi:acetolactate synthase-1/2/3 large subunit